MRTLLVLAFAMTLLPSVSHSSVTHQPFGKMPDGSTVEIYTLKNQSLEARIMTYGGIIVSLQALDRHGKMADIVLGFDSLDSYLAGNPAYFGALIGRYGNRIAKGTFKLDGHSYSVPQNNNGNSLHGGTRGFDKVVWTAKALPNGVELTYVSKDGEMGYPGTMTSTVRYIMAGHDLRIEYAATTDKPTVLNLTNHTYFNLAGQGDILKHELRLNSEKYTPVDGGLIPTGELAPVAGTPFDFRKPTSIGARIDADNEQLKLGKGYDHNWVLHNGGKLEEAAEAHDASTGRTLQVLTDQPGVQFYTGNFLDGTLTGKGGKIIGRRTGFCLETQHFPDSPNHPNFPSTELKPGHHFHSVTVFRFGSR